ncbi:hypothetical protein [uncultured Sphingomonas sp.]|uniref:hypothetical protein n=1 Tax=uncultured Sphingomonas sp. TaxID=158754 RepID=UPI0035CBD5E1
MAEADPGIRRRRAASGPPSDTAAVASAGAIPRVRFAVDFADDESIPGMMVRAATEHVLHRVALIYDAAGVDCVYPGHAQLLPRADLDRIALVVRADPDRLAANAGERIHSTNFGATHQRARFGDLTLIRGHLELYRRRIGPVSLRSSAHHRVAWLNGLLPYCPVSLERLVDICGLCSETLGWLWTWGVGVCEWCERTVPASTEAPLPAGMATHYRLFAALASPVEAVRAAARASLPERLRSVGYATLIRLACRVGLICRDKPITRCTQHEIDALDPMTLASVVATGAAMLADWPTSFERFVHARADALRDNREGFLLWRTLLRRISTVKSEGEEQSALVLEVLPDLKGSFERSFAGGDRYYLPNETARCWGVDHDQVLKAVDARAVRVTHLPGITRRRMQFDAVQVEAIGRLLRSTPAIHSLPGSLGLPLYGVEQLIDARLLRWERHPAVLAIREWVCVQRRSLDLLLERLDKSVRTGTPPKDAVSLRAASRRIGGREKPWSAIIAAILTGRLRVWGDGGPFNARKILVRPCDLAQFDTVVFAATGSAFPFSNLITQDDLGELLNVAPKYLVALTADLDLQFAEVGRAECTDKVGAITAAQRMASSAEIGHHMGLSSRKANTAMRNGSIKKVSVGWDRRQLMHLGILPGA